MTTDNYRYQVLKDLPETDDIKILRNSTVWGYKVTLYKIVDGRPVSTISIAQYDNDPNNEVWIYELTTDYKYVGRGYASELINHAINLCKNANGIDTILLRYDSIDLADWYKKSFGIKECKINGMSYLKIDSK